MFQEPHLQGRIPFGVGAAGAQTVLSLRPADRRYPRHMHSDSGMQAGAPARDLRGTHLRTVRGTTRKHRQVKADPLHLLLGRP